MLSQSSAVGQTRPRMPPKAQPLVELFRKWHSIIIGVLGKEMTNHFQMNPLKNTWPDNVDP